MKTSKMVTKELPDVFNNSIILQKQQRAITRAVMAPILLIAFEIDIRRAYGNTSTLRENCAYPVQWKQRCFFAIDKIPILRN